MWYTKDGTRTLAYEYEYTADGKPHTLRNNLNGKTELYKYDAWSNFTSTTYSTSGASGSLQGCNLYAYCFNNPIMLTDENGNWPSWNDVKEFFGNIFGASSSVEKTIVEEKTNILSFPSPIHITESYEKTQTLSEIGDSSKPLSVYSVLDADNVITSSAGFKINMGDASLNVNLSLDDISVSGKVSNDNVTNSLGVKLNLSKLQLGFEGSTSIQNGSFSNTASFNISVDALSSAFWIATAKLFGGSGSLIPIY